MADSATSEEFDHHVMGNNPQESPSSIGTDPGQGTPAPDGPKLFDKCRKFYAPDSIYQRVKQAGLYPYFRPIERQDGTRAIIQGRDVVMAGSNNYLGLMSDPRVKQAAADAISQYGTGCTGSRFLNGTLDLHIEAEHRLAEFMGGEACVLFSTGYMTNQGVLQALATKGDIIMSDKDNHSCIVAGTQVSLADTWRYRHNDVKQLREQFAPSRVSARRGFSSLERISGSSPNSIIGMAARSTIFRSPLRFRDFALGSKPSGSQCRPWPFSRMVRL